MFDFHLHSSLSFDSNCSPRDIVEKAEALGLREICFTDHYDFCDEPYENINSFTVEEYNRAYGSLSSASLKIRRGIELGITPSGDDGFKEKFEPYGLDYVIGSVHYVKGYDPYNPDFWEVYDVDKAFELYLLKTLECVRANTYFDALGHLNYVCKSPSNPGHKPLLYKDYADICDEIMKILAQNGRGMEINTSGVDRVGDFLPARDFIKRFRELGGEIITVGSDSHDASRVGQYAGGALEIAKDVFGYVCTFEKRKPIYHKL